MVVRHRLEHEPVGPQGQPGDVAHREGLPDRTPLGSSLDAARLRSGNAGGGRKADGFPRTCSLSPYTAARRRCGSGLDAARLRSGNAGGGRRRMGSRAPVHSPRTPPRGGGVGPALDSARLRPREPRSREAAGGGGVPAHLFTLPVHRREAAVWVALTNTLTGAYICSYERRGQSGRTACDAGQTPPHAA